jgi:hypothetical protein
LFLSCLGQAGPTLIELQQLTLWTETRGIYSVKDLIQPDQTWIRLEEVENLVRSSHEVGRNVFEELFTFMVSLKGVTESSLNVSCNWFWTGGEKPLRGWDLTVKQWRTLTENPVIPVSMWNSRWGV